MADVGPMPAVEPEVVAVFIQDEDLGRHPGREHPLPLGHDRLGGADDPGHVIVLRLEFAVELFARRASRIISDAIDAAQVFTKIPRKADRKSTRLNSSHVEISYA